MRMFRNVESKAETNWVSAIDFRAPSAGICSSILLTLVALQPTSGKEFRSQ
jgi:hypothetical protein